jgi:AcrR family transcriptional regulator
MSTSGKKKRSGATPQRAAPQDTATQDAAPQRARAGRPAGLSRPAVVDAALAVADRSGVEALTMRGVAAELGCGVMTLYTYVRDRGDLLSGVIARLIDEVDVRHEPGESWETVARRGAATYRAMALRHPRAFPALALAPSADPGLQAHLERILEGLVAGGLSRSAARDLFGVLDSFASGFLLMELSWPEERAEAAESLEPFDEDAYRRGLELILAGARSVLVGERGGAGD